MAAISLPPRRNLFCSYLSKNSRFFGTLSLSSVECLSSEDLELRHPLPRGREVGRLHTEELSCRAYWVAMLPQLPVAGVSTSAKNRGIKKKATSSKTVNPP